MSGTWQSTQSLSNIPGFDWRHELRRFAFLFVVLAGNYALLAWHFSLLHNNWLTCMFSCVLWNRYRKIPLRTVEFVRIYLKVAILGDHLHFQFVSREMKLHISSPITMDSNNPSWTADTFEVASIVSAFLLIVSDVAHQETLLKILASITVSDTQIFQPKLFQLFCTKSEEQRSSHRWSCFEIAFIDFLRTSLN